jgi:hypothetical protein
MKQDPEQEPQLRRYLLGELRLEEQILIEQRLFLDRDYAELAQSVEDDLIDDYVQDDLTAVERQKFETHFLKTHEHREDLRIAQAFQRQLGSEPITPYAASQVIQPSWVTVGARESLRKAGAVYTTDNNEEQPAALLSTAPKRKPVIWFALAAAVLIVVSIVTWIAVRSIKKPSEPLEAREPQPAPIQSPQHGPSPSLNSNSGGETVERHGGPVEPNKRPPNERPRPQLEQQPSTIAAVTIYPGGIARSGGPTNTVRITSEQTQVTLRLPLSTTKDYERYRLELFSGQRRIHVQTLGPKPDEAFGRVVYVTFSARLFTQTLYEIKLRGFAGTGTAGGLDTYFFTVQREP